MKEFGFTLGLDLVMYYYLQVHFSTTLDSLTPVFFIRLVSISQEFFHPISEVSS